MPNRIIREGILTSDRVNKLTWEQEVFYRRLLSIVDDYGCFDARASILRTALYPLKIDQMREDSVLRCLQACEAVQLLVLYSVEGKPYLEVVDFRQQVRSKNRKFPARDTQMISKCYARDTQMHTKAESESKTYKNIQSATVDSDSMGETMPTEAHSLGDSCRKQGATSQIKPDEPDELDALPSLSAIEKHFLNSQVRFPADKDTKRSAEMFHDWLIHQKNWQKVRNWRTRGALWLKSDVENNLSRPKAKTHRKPKQEDANLGRNYDLN